MSDTKSAAELARECLIEEYGKSAPENLDDNFNGPEMLWAYEAGFNVRDAEVQDLVEALELVRTSEVICCDRMIPVAKVMPSVKAALEKHKKCL